LRDNSSLMPFPLPMKPFHTPSGAAALHNGYPADLSQPVQYAKGVGPRRAELLGKLGIRTIRDGLYFFPVRYEDRGNFTKIAHVAYGSYETVSGVVASASVVTTARRRMKIFELMVKDETGFITGVWFNQPFMQSVFKEGQRVILSGVARPDAYRKYRPIIENPEYEIIEEDGEETIHTGRVVPIYRATAGISVRQIRSVMKGLVDHYAPVLDEFLPPAFLDRYRIPPLPDAVREVHFPDREKDVSLLNARATRAQKRLIFDEFFLVQLGLALMKRGRVVARGGMSLKGDGRLGAKLYSMLPYELTSAQKRVISEIRADMERPVQMNRLLQGDVGCGKTVVAIAAILQAAEAGCQSALMAPTEILAEQHYLNLKKPFETLGLETVLLTSSLKKKEKEAVLGDIKAGRAVLAVGTHSLIQEGVEFDRLGLAIIDEQHRFGVMQRAVLGGKGASPDILVMTATPIPRTLALTVYGDLDVSVIDEMPKGRAKVITKLFEDRTRDEAYRLMRRELSKGRQAYVVYPLIEESEKSDLKAAKEGAEALAALFDGYSVGLLHGRMKPAEKERVMDEFRAGRINVLVATTVVEVGVDVPNATVMVVEHAERFGLAQLHQLRGRVGRSGHQSYCVLLASGFSPASRDRIAAMLKSASGFDIAEEDLRIRGPGEFFGTKQSGLPEITYGNIIRDSKILNAAHKEAFDIIKLDPELASSSAGPLKAELVRKWKDRLGLITVS
jgi:ATP-dependent DNA helicase RecG